MVEMVSRKRGEGEVPWNWIPKHNLRDAFKEYKNTARNKVSQIAASRGVSKEKVKEEHPSLRTPDTLAEFTKLLWGTPREEYREEGVTKARKKQTFLTVPPQSTPWSQARGYVMREMELAKEVKQAKLVGKPEKVKATREQKVGQLNKKLGGMEFGHGIRVVWNDFGAGEEVLSSRQVTDEIEQLIENRGIPEWPGTPPEQIGLLIKTPGRGKTKTFEMSFAKATDYAGSLDMYEELRTKVPREREIVDNQVWSYPHAITTDDSYTMARTILGTKKDEGRIRTYEYTPTELYKLIPAE